MTRLRSSVLTLMLVFAFGPTPQAHQQRFIGWVTAVEGEHVHIKTTEDKTVVVMLHAKSKIVRGKEPQTAKDITAGDRIVATTTDGKDAKGRAMLMVKEIRLGTGAGAAPKK